MQKFAIIVWNFGPFNGSKDIVLFFRLFSPPISNDPQQSPNINIIILAAIVIGRWNYNPPPERDCFLSVSYWSVLILFTLPSDTTHFLLSLCIVILVHYNIRILNLTLKAISCFCSPCDHHVLVPGAVDLVTTLSNSHGELSKMPDITLLQSWCFCSCTEEQDEREDRLKPTGNYVSKH